MSTEINFTGSLNDEDTRVALNLPRKTLTVSTGAALTSGVTAVTEAESCSYNALLDLDRKRLLHQASLVVLPSTYGEGRLFSQKPTYNTNGTFTVTRATTATRVNSAGLVELVPYNLLQYSEQFDNAAWAKSSCTISANTTTAPDGTLTADKFIGTAVNSTHRLFQTTDSSSYGFSIYAKAGEETTFSMWVANAAKRAEFNLALGTITISTVATSSITDVGNGWYRCFVYDPSPTTTYSIYGRDGGSYLGNGTNGLYLWGAQANEGSAALPYQKTETRLNIPRIDYSLGGCPNILLEPQRTNLALQSSSFDSASWAKVGVTITANSIASPSGIQDADTITQSGANININQVINIGTAGNYTYSVYVKKGNFDSSNNFRFGVYRGSDLGYITFNFATNTTSVISGTFVSHSSKSVGNGWYLIQYTINIPTTGSANFYNGGTGGNIGAGNFFYSWGAQLEQGAYATSYIPTTTASVTRNADFIQNTNASSLIGQTSGVFFFDFFYKQSIDAFTDLWWINNSTNSYILRMRTGSSNSLNFLYANGGSAQNLTTGFTLIPNNNYKVAVSYDYATTTSKLFVNGVLIGTTVGPIAYPTNQGKIYNGNLFSNISFLNLQTFAVFPTPLTDAQCSMLTSGIYPTAAAAYASLGLVSESPSCLTSTTTF